MGLRERISTPRGDLNGGLAPRTRLGAPACPGSRGNPGSLPEDFHLEREVAAEAKTGLLYMAKP